MIAKIEASTRFPNEQSLILCSPNEDFGKPSKHSGTYFQSTFHMNVRLRILLGRAARSNRAALRKLRLFHVCGLVVVQDQLVRSIESVANYLTDDRTGIVAKLVGNCARVVLKGCACVPARAKERAFEPC